MASDNRGGVASSPAAGNRVGATGLAWNLSTGTICGFLAIVQSIGFGMLLVGSEALSFVPTAVGMALFSTAVMAAIAALTSATPGVVSIAQGIPITALAGPVAAIIAATSASATDIDTAATIVVGVALATIAIGCTALLLGGLRLGRFVRFVPFPVIGGFLAGSGWLIFLGGIGVVAGERLTFANVGALLDPHRLAMFAVAFAFLALAFLLRNRYAVAVVLPMVTLAAVILFNGVVLVAGLDQEALQASGWLIAVADGGALWPPIALSDIASVDWGAIAGQAAALPTVAVLTVIAVLMNATGIELDARRDVDLDRELRSVGLQNLAGGLGAGMPGFQSVSLTALSNRLGAGSPIVGLIVSALCVAALVLGDDVLSIVPTPLLGGLLIWIGLSLLVAWLGRAYNRVSPLEYGVIILIFAVIVGVSFAWGILVGLIAAAVLFVIEYGRVEIVRYIMTGRDYQSSNETSEARRAVLRTAGDAILIVRLQGFLFFGTADRLRKRIERRIADQIDEPVRFLVVDFQRVTGLDSSTVVAFTRLAQATDVRGFSLVFCDTSDAVETALRRSGVEVESENVRFESDLDHALEWCEDHLIAAVAPQVASATIVPVADLVTDVVGDRQVAESILPYLEPIYLEAGSALIEEGAPSPDIFFLETGRASVELGNGSNDKSIRVATVGRGSIVGELAFYLGRKRSASVIARSPLVAWRLSADALDRLCDTDPKTAVAFHRGMARMLGDRLAGTNQLVRLLAD
ncbi:SulP family inorganic anion transporter [Bauldia sp.]|uniref:SulP family inorganic anion transporter n=1 Tax=Bauldia sp. TaxID=2575872 RepID=UPI003BADBABD